MLLSMRCIMITNSCSGAVLVAEDLSGRQPAHMAAIRNHPAIVEFLYSQGVELDCPCKAGKLPLHYAAQHGGKVEVSLQTIQVITF